jgi:HSP20 family protein
MESGGPKPIRKLSSEEVAFMTGYKGSTELAKTERPRFLAPFEEMERWIEDVFRSPLSLLSRRVWPEERELAEFETLSPRVDIFEEGNEVVLKADMPGIEKRDIDITLADNMLTVSGERTHEEKVEKGSYVRCERTHGSFFRRFEIPSGIDAEKIKAHLDNGVLEVRLPKTEEAKSKSKKITVS